MKQYNRIYNGDLEHVAQICIHNSTDVNWYICINDKYVMHSIKKPIVKTKTKKKHFGNTKVQDESC